MANLKGGSLYTRTRGLALGYRSSVWTADGMLMMYDLVPLEWYRQGCICLVEKVFDGLRTNIQSVARPSQTAESLLSTDGFLRV